MLPQFIIFIIINFSWN